MTRISLTNYADAERYRRDHAHMDLCDVCGQPADCVAHDGPVMMCAACEQAACELAEPKGPEDDYRQVR
jgi:hypothetical protein